MFSKLISKVIGDKRRWRQYKARIRGLPTNYRMTERHYTMRRRAP